MIWVAEKRLPLEQALRESDRKDVLTHEVIERCASRVANRGVDMLWIVKKKKKKKKSSGTHSVLMLCNSYSMFTNGTLLRKFTFITFWGSGSRPANPFAHCYERTRATPSSKPQTPPTAHEAGLSYCTLICFRISHAAIWLAIPIFWPRGLLKTKIISQDHLANILLQKGSLVGSSLYQKCPLHLKVGGPWTQKTSRRLVEEVWLARRRSFSIHWFNSFIEVGVKQRTKRNLYGDGKNQ